MAVAIIPTENWLANLYLVIEGDPQYALIDSAPHGARLLERRCLVLPPGWKGRCAQSQTGNTITSAVSFRRLTTESRSQIKRDGAPGAVFSVIELHRNRGSFLERRSQHGRSREKASEEGESDLHF